MRKATKTALFLLTVALLALGLLLAGCGKPAEKAAEKKEEDKPETTPLKPLPPPVNVDEMVFVPAGECVIGGAPAAPTDMPKGSPAETAFLGTKPSSPAHKVNLKAFWIDKYEVTFKQYIDFVLASKYKAEGNVMKIYHTRRNSLEPVFDVTLKDAQEYAKWAKKRLPTNEEWEKAAGWDPTAKKQVRYPWGNEWKDNGANTAEANGLLAEVGVYKDDVSPYGCHDMLGNVYEWTSSFYEMYPGCDAKYRDPNFGKSFYVVKGGSIKLGGRDRYMTMRSYSKPDFMSGQGFRCVRDATPDEEKQQAGK